MLSLMLSPGCCAQELIKQLLFSEEADAYIVDRIAAGLAVTKMAGQTEQQRVEHHVGLALVIRTRPLMMTFGAAAGKCVVACVTRPLKAGVSGELVLVPGS